MHAFVFIANQHCRIHRILKHYTAWQAAQCDGVSYHTGTRSIDGATGKPLPRTLPAGFKYHSDEDIPGAVQAAGAQQQSAAAPMDGWARSNTTSKDVDTSVILAQLESNRKLQEALMESMDTYRVWKLVKLVE